MLALVLLLSCATAILCAAGLPSIASATAADGVQQEEALDRPDAGEPQAGERDEADGSDAADETQPGDQADPDVAIAAPLSCDDGDVELMNTIPNNVSWTEFPYGNEASSGQKELTAGYYRVSKTPNHNWGSYYSINGVVTIDLNGVEFYQREEDPNSVLFTIKEDSELTIIDSSANPDGTGGKGIINGNKMNVRMINVTGQKAKLNIESGTLKNSGGGLVYAAKGTTINMSGGTLDGQLKGGGYSGTSNLYLDGATLNLSGGIIEHSDASGIEAYDGSKIEMTGGTITYNNNKNTGGNAKAYGGGISLNGGKWSGSAYTSGKGSTLTMSGGTISHNTTSEAGAGVSVSGVGNSSTTPCSFTFKGGTITENSTYENGDDSGHGGGIFVAYNGEFTMSDGTVSNNNARWGGGICIGSYAISGSSATKKEECTGNVSIIGGTISGNKATKSGNTQWSGTGGGGINIGYSSPSSKSPITIGDTIQITNNTGQDYGGGIAVFESDVELTGGTISGNETKLSRDTVTSVGGTATHYGGAGLFVFLADQESTGSTFTMSGGEITNNTSAGGGGGIYVDGIEERTEGVPGELGDPNKPYANYGIFKMTGGTVSNNIASSTEGGGIRVRWARADIIAGEGKKIYITGNKTETTEDWGGGGIFCEVGGYLNVTDALITGNTAQGFGGGVAACSTGDDDFTYQQATAIFGNEAKGTAESGTSSEKDKDHILSEQKQLIQTGDAQDYFNANFSAVAGVMLGGGDPKWSGKYGNTDGVDAEGKAKYTQEELIQLPYGSILKATGYAALTSNPSDYDKQVAENNAKVFITGNTSSVHGGGILNNGVMFLGAANGDALFAPQINKTITGVAKGEDAPEGTFIFSVVRGTYNASTGFTPTEGAYNEQVTITSKLPYNGIVRFAPDIYVSGTNAEDGEINTETTLYYLITETSGSTGYTYDTSRWLLTVNVGAETNSFPAVMGADYTTLSIASYSYQKLDSSGKPMGDTETAASFTNAVYVPPVIPGPTTPSTGSLTIHKAIVGGPDEALDKTYSFLVAGPGGFSRTVTVTGSGSVTLRNLTPGNYTVSEVGGEIDGYLLTVTIPDGGAVAVKRNATAEVTVTNNYEEGVPDGPLGPDDPSFADDPSNPSDPNTPTNPTKPGSPTDPTNPTKPGGDRHSSAPTGKQNALPQTGDSTPVALPPILLVAGVGAILLGLLTLPRSTPRHLKLAGQARKHPAHPPRG